MKMLRALLVTMILACASIAQAQSYAQAGSITTNGSDCSTATNCVVLQFNPQVQGSASIWITGTWTGTAQFEVTSDQIPINASAATINALTWVSVSATPAASTTTTTSATANGLWFFNAANITALRVRSSASMTGTIAVTLRGSTASARGGGGGSGGSGTPNIYTVATLPAGLGVGGTGTIAAVKDGSTASDCTVGGGSNAVACIWTGSAWAFAGSAASAPAFSGITTGSNSTATMTVAAGGTLTFSTTGVVNADQLNGGSIPASAPLLGTNSSKQPISVTTVPTSTFPALTGDVTTPGASLATTVVAVNGGSVPASAKILGSNSSSQPVAAGLTSAHVYVGNGSNLPADVAVSGDVSLTNAGVATVTQVNGGAVPASAKILGSNSSSQPVAAGLNSTHIYVGNGSNLPADVAVSQDISMANTGAATVTGIQGSAVPASASVVGTNSSSQIVADTAHVIQVPFTCNDSSGSATAQTCTTAPTFTPAYKDCIFYTTTTANSGDLTLNVNSTSAMHVYKWQGASVLSAGDMAAQQPAKLCLDNGVNVNSSQGWELDTIGNPPAGTGGTINNSNQYSGTYYTGPGSNNTLSGFAGPTTQGNFNYTWANTTNAVSVPQPVQVGLGGRAITGSATTCGASGVLYSDVNSVIDHDQAATGTVGCTLPTPTTLNNSSFGFRYTNHSAQTDTITPSGGFTIQVGNSAATSSLSVATGVGCTIKVDPNSSTNWLADCSVNTGATGTGTVNSGTKGQPAVFPSTSNAVSASPLWIDASQFSGTDMCAKIQAAIAASATNAAGTIDARGFSGNQTCSAANATGMLTGLTGDLYLGNVALYVPLVETAAASFSPNASLPPTGTFVKPNTTHIHGMGSSAVSGTGVNTLIGVCTGTNTPITGCTTTGSSTRNYSITTTTITWSGASDDKAYMQIHGSGFDFVGKEPIRIAGSSTLSNNGSWTICQLDTTGARTANGRVDPDCPADPTSTDVYVAVPSGVVSATIATGNGTITISGGSPLINATAVSTAGPNIFIQNPGQYPSNASLTCTNTGGTCTVAKMASCAASCGTVYGEIPIIDDGPSGSGNAFSQETDHMIIDCHGLNSAVGFRSLWANEASSLHDVNILSCLDRGIDIHNFKAQNAAAIRNSRVAVVASVTTACTIGTEGVFFGDSGPHGLQDFTADLSSCSSPVNAGIRVETDQYPVYIQGAHSENTLWSILYGQGGPAFGVSTLNFAGAPQSGLATTDGAYQNQQQAAIKISNDYQLCSTGCPTTTDFIFMDTKRNNSSATFTIADDLNTVYVKDPETSFYAFDGGGSQQTGFLGTCSTCISTVFGLSAPNLYDSNMNKLVQLSATASAVDYVKIAGGATGSPGTSTISAVGSDTNVNLNLVSKGSGTVECNGSTCAALGTAETFTALQTFGANASIGTTAHGPLLSENTSAAVAAGAGTAGQFFGSGGASADGAYQDFYHAYDLPAARPNDGVIGSLWAIPTSNGCSVTAKTGTNVLDAALTCTTSQSAQQKVLLTAWDTGVNPYIRFSVTSTDTTNGHTIIPTVSASCSKGDGTATYDNAFQTAQSGSTVTFGASEVASAPITTSTVQLNSTSMTNCVKGSVLYLKFSFSGSSTATDLEYYGVKVTVPELNVAGAQ